MRQYNIIFSRRNPKWRHREGPVKLQYETNKDKRQQKLSDRRKGVIKKLFELEMIVGAKVFLKIIPESGNTSVYSSDELMSAYREGGIVPAQKEKRIQH